MNLHATARLARGLLTAALLSAASVAMANATHDTFVDVAGSAATDGFNSLINSRITTDDLVRGIPGNVAGSSGGATFSRTSGTFYPAGSGLYAWSGQAISTFSFDVGNAVDGLSQVTLQSFVQISNGSNNVWGLLSGADAATGGKNTLPTLSYNGGMQALSATSLVTKSYDYVDYFTEELVSASPTNPNNAFFTWDLSGVSEPIKSFTIDFGIDLHSNAIAFQLDQVALVPEPATMVLLLSGFGGLGVLSRRRALKVQA